MKIYLFLLCFLIASNVFSQKFEAESAILSGGATKVASSAASGGYYVAQNGGYLSFDINVETEGTYNIYIQVASPAGFKANNFSIDGSLVTFSTDQNANYIRFKVVSFVKLAAGTHKILITKSWGYINIDYIEFEQVDPATRYSINKTLVTPAPTNEAIRLYQFLLDNYGKKIISGTMTLASMDEVNWLKTNTGKKPALVGLDFMHTNRGYTWYNDLEPGNDAQTYYNKNGIPAMCWHWRDPSRKTESFYTTGTSFDISKIFDETSAEYKAMLS